MNSMLPVDAAVSAFLQVILLAGVPFLGYCVYQKWRHKRSFSEIALGERVCRVAPGGISSTALRSRLPESS
jgi:hypothetical protein